MKYTWEASDFTSTPTQMGVGHLMQHGAGETYMVGYMASISSTEARLLLVSLRDGMARGPYTPQHMANEANAAGYVPLVTKVRAEAKVLGK